MAPQTQKQLIKFLKPEHILHVPGKERTRVAGGGSRRDVNPGKAEVSSHKAL